MLWRPCVSLMNATRACPAGFGGMCAISLYCEQEAAVGWARKTHGGLDVRAGYLMDCQSDQNKSAMEEAARVWDSLP